MRRRGPFEQGRREDGTAPSASRRILVVDDNCDSADSLGMLLKFLGADVSIANDGPAALEALETYRPSVVFLGHRNAGDGWLRGRPTGTTIVRGS
jgi:PleD family two-component response regulator